MDRLTATTAVFLIAYGGAWIVAGVVDLPLLWYAPLQHEWHLQVEAPTPVSMDWYGRVVLGALAGALGGGVAWFVFPRLSLKRVPWRPILVAWAAGVMLLCMFLYAYTLSRRVVYPPAPADLSVPGSP